MPPSLPKLNGSLMRMAQQIKDSIKNAVPLSVFTSELIKKYWRGKKPDPINPLMSATLALLVGSYLTSL